jgi:hypothetical protein
LEALSYSAAAGDHRFDPAGPEQPAVFVMVIATISEDKVGFLARSASLADPHYGHSRCRGADRSPPNVLEREFDCPAPAHLRGILSRISGKVHAVLDRRTREVHVNPTTDLVGQQAFKRLHETSHDLFNRQHVDDGQNGFADDLWTLSPKTHILFEREANQGAAELLFQRDRFANIALDYAVSSGAVIELSERFGSSIHAAFRRYVETHHGAVAGVVLGARPCEHEPLGFARKEAICSDAWRTRFEDPAVWSRVLRATPFAFVDQARACGGLGSPAGEWRYLDRNNETTALKVEAMNNSYRTFVLIWLPQRERFKHRRVIAKAA